MRPRANSGFSLLEAIVATAVAGMAIAGLLSLTSQALSNAAEVRGRDRAAMLAQSKMNELLSQNPLPLGVGLAGEFDSESGWRAEAAPFELPPPDQPQAPGLVRIELEIWWEMNGQRRKIELEGYRRMHLGAPRTDGLQRAGF